MLKENRYDILVIFFYDSRHLTLTCPPFASFVEFWGRARKLGGDDAKRADEDEVRVYLPSAFSCHRRLPFELIFSGSSVNPCASIIDTSSCSWCCAFHGRCRVLQRPIQSRGRTGYLSILFLCLCCASDVRWSRRKVRKAVARQISKRSQEVSMQTRSSKSSRPVYASLLVIACR